MSSSDLLSIILLIPEDERRETQHYLNAVRGLEDIVAGFGSALKLFEFCMQEGLAANLKYSTMPFTSGHDPRIKFDLIRKYGGWSHIAARDAAMQIYNLAVVMEKLRSNLYRCPALRNITNTELLKAAHKSVLGHFPNNRLIRDASAHSLYELMPNIRELDSHATDSPDGTVPGLKGDLINSVWFGLAGNSYTVTKDKRICTVQINAMTLELLRTASEMFFSGFDEAVEAARRDMMRRSLQAAAARQRSD
jgi:hypothetical protein